MATKVAKGDKTKTKQLAGMDLPFFIIIMILMTFGLVMMFSASYAWGLYEAGDSFIYIRKQLILAAIGVAGMLVISMIDYRIYMKKFIVFGLFIISLAMLIYVGFFGPIINGARRWIVLGPINFQPSEVMKLSIILLFYYIISVNYTKLNKFSYGIVPFMAVLGTVAGLMMVQPHLSGTIIICSIGIIMMFVGGSNIKHLTGIGVVGVIGLVVAVIVLIQVSGIGYFQDRIEGFLDPMSDVKDSTFQTYQSLVTIGSGGIFGLGLGNSMQKFRYLPESHNDFVFSIVCEELGFIGAMLIIILFSLFIFRGFYIASKSPDKFGMMLAVGLTVQIGLQALLNIAVVTNSIPNTGVSLPFFSYGGTALMMQLFQMGIMLNISRHAALD